MEQIGILTHLVKRHFSVDDAPTTLRGPRGEAPASQIIGTHSPTFEVRPHDMTQSNYTPHWAKN